MNVFEIKPDGEVIENDLDKQMNAIEPFKGLGAVDIETYRSQYGERLSISVDTSIDDDTDEAIVMPVLLFVPFTDEFAHEHIEIKDPQKLYDWLGEFLKVQKEN